MAYIMKNVVIEGDYKNCSIQNMGGRLEFWHFIKKKVELNADTVESWEILKEIDPKLALIGKGIAMAAENTTLVRIRFKDGKKSLINLSTKYLLKFESILDDLKREGKQSK